MWVYQQCHYCFKKIHLNKIRGVNKTDIHNTKNKIFNSGHCPSCYGGLSYSSVTYCVCWLGCHTATIHAYVEKGIIYNDVSQFLGLTRRVTTTAVDVGRRFPWWAVSTTGHRTSEVSGGEGRPVSRRSQDVLSWCHVFINTRLWE